jgi:hypothetical protein
MVMELAQYHHLIHQNLLRSYSEILQLLENTGFLMATCLCR